MRSLTIEEKALSQAARKRANTALKADRQKIDKQRRAAIKAKADESYRARLLQQIQSMKDVKGSPVIVRLDGQDAVLNYELLHGLHRKLKRRHVNLKIERQTLIIVHHLTLWGGDKGYIELYELPDYQRLHLSDLPIIKLNTD
ncbi:hypothetical protein J7E73_02385 [Paenibacillus albidus]|uniref:hypothetical protein n=1 Tax=Paenibacillus albidus TaxID=2041023 RepID=UPI001BEC9AC5|nr:hypothetical protein [Paenibacillus albidus]MBT2287994.1 hypothetical protein [Paenibacillus albidus]